MLLAGAALLVVTVVVAVIWLRGGGAAAAGPAPDQGGPEPAADPVRVEVLNGSGRAGLARDATQRLRAAGFDVVYFGNAARFDHPVSHVVDRAGDTLSARTVAHALGIDSVTSQPDPRLLLEVTVVLGRDWPPPEPQATGPRARLQRLMAPEDTEP
jgi:hypothetical protein